MISRRAIPVILVLVIGLPMLAAAQDPDIDVCLPPRLGEYQFYRSMPSTFEVTLCYDAGDDGVAPDKVRYLLVEASLDGGDDWVTNEYEFDNSGRHLVDFGLETWSDWVEWGDPEAGHSVSFSLPASDPWDPVYYLMAFQVKDVNGSRSTELDYAGSVHNFRISDTLSPGLIVRERNTGLQLVGVERMDDVAMGQVLDFEWYGDGDQYGASVIGYRWGFDLADPDDPDDPGWAVNYGLDAEHMGTGEVSFQQGTHRLTVACRDLAGGVTVKHWDLVVVPMHDYADRRPLLLVDDVLDRNSLGWPDAGGVARDADVHRDAFWQDVLLGVEGWHHEADVIDTYDDMDWGLREAVDYRVLLWATKIGAANYITLNTGLSTGSIPWLETYVRDLGNLFMVGSGAMTNFTPVGADGMNWLYPIIYDTDESGGMCGVMPYALSLGSGQDIHGNPYILGRETFAYDVMGLSVSSLLVPGAFFNGGGGCGSGGIDRTRRCAASKGIILDEAFKAQHGLGSAFPDTVLNWDVIDWQDEMSIEGYPYAFGGIDEFYDVNATVRETEWNQQVVPGTDDPYVVPMWRTYNRYDWILDQHAAAGEEFPGDIDVNLPSTCGSWTVDPETGRTKTDGAPLGVMTYKSIVNKPVMKADVLWGFDPHRLDHDAMRRAIRWVLGSHFDLQLAEWVGNEGSGEQEETPSVTALHACRPNPFNPATVISFALESPQRAEVAVFDLRGRRVALLSDEPLTAGPHEVTWRGTDDAGRAVAAGTYVIRLRTDDRVLMKTATLLK